MIRMTLAAVFAFSLTVSAGEWRYWTWPGKARMSTVVGRTAWFATSGGVFEWNLDENTSKLHQRSDGLPNTDIVSIANQKDGSIWAVCSDGHMAVKRANESVWQSKGTFSAEPSPWSFNPRVVAMHRNAKTGKEVLILGGPKGLAFFPADSTTSLDWVDQFPSLGKREVRAVTLINDTLWVGLMGGLLRVVPPWDSLGNNRAFISDPKRWTILAQTEATDDYSALFPTSAGMTWQPDYKWGSSTVLVKPEYLYWSGVPYAVQPTSDRYGNSVLFPVHAYDNGNELLVSSDATFGSASTFEGYSKGPLLIKKDGSFRTPPLPANAVPVPTPPAVILEQGMQVTAWSTNQVLTWSRGQPNWQQPWKGAFISTVNPASNFDLTDNGGMNTFARGAKRSIWAGTWGTGLWAALPTDSTGDTLVWQNWNSSNSCLEGAAPQMQSFVTINALTVTDSAAWGVTFRTSADSAIAFSTALDGSQLNCWKFPTPGAYNRGIIVQSNRIWIASSAGLRSFKRPSTSSKALTQIHTTPGVYQAANLITLDGRDVLVGLTASSVIVVASNGSTDTTLANSSSQTSSLNPRQEWKKMAIDGLGQIWLAGIEGIDILSIQADADGYQFVKVRSITTDDGLPSNLVYNLSIDPSSGMVMVATDKGLGLWSSPYRPLAEKLESKKARVYPNPLRTRTHSELVVDGATATSHFYLHAADGSLVVHLSPSEQTGGYFRWTLPSTDKLRPGVYRWTLKDDNSKVGGPLLIAE